MLYRHQTLLESLLLLLVPVTQLPQHRALTLQLLTFPQRRMNLSTTMAEMLLLLAQVQQPELVCIMHSNAMILLVQARLSFPKAPLLLLLQQALPHQFRPQRHLHLGNPRLQ